MVQIFGVVNEIAERALLVRMPIEVDKLVADAKIVQTSRLTQCRIQIKIRNNEVTAMKFE